MRDLRRRVRVAEDGRLARVLPEGLHAVRCDLVAAESPVLLGYVVPEPYELILLALAAARVWKLIGDDRILDRPRDWALSKLRSDESETYWGDFLVCPWCAGFWVCVLWWGAWLIWPYGTLVAAGLWAISALVGLFGVTVDKITD